MWLSEEVLGNAESSDAAVAEAEASLGDISTSAFASPQATTEEMDVEAKAEASAGQEAEADGGVAAEAEEEAKGSTAGPTPD